MKSLPATPSFSTFLKTGLLPKNGIFINYNDNINGNIREVSFIQKGKIKTSYLAHLLKTGRMLIYLKNVKTKAGLIHIEISLLYLMVFYYKVVFRWNL
ncbi:hypothetical protein BSG1_03895 [Bacillus sp. SG-1]|nr:hypothetical protein BSG1_03895 [Bacillus sp. SG-1]